MSDYKAFNIKDVLSTIREETKDRIEDLELGKKKSNFEGELETIKKILSYISKIPDDMTFEELPIYQEYLSKFALSPFFRDKPLLTDVDDKLSKADSDLFLKFVCGSFSSSYQIAYNEEKESLELVIHVEVKDGSTTKKSITKKLDELWWFQIEQMFIIYLSELLSLEYFLKNNIDKDSNEEAMGIRLVTFEKNMRMLEANIQRDNSDDNDIDAELEELLNN